MQRSPFHLVWHSLTQKRKDRRSQVQRSCADDGSAADILTGGDEQPFRAVVTAPALRVAARSGPRNGSVPRSTHGPMSRRGGVRPADYQIRQVLNSRPVEDASGAYDIAHYRLSCI
jgi:hypothetical protein